MSNPLYALLGGGNPMQNAYGSIMSAVNELRADPVKMLKQAGFSIPNGIEGNPQSIISYLLQSGQVNQGRLAQAQQLAAKYR